MSILARILEGLNAHLERGLSRPSCLGAPKGVPKEPERRELVPPIQWEELATTGFRRELVRALLRERANRVYRRCGRDVGMEVRP